MTRSQHQLIRTGVATVALLAATALAPARAPAKVYFTAFPAEGGTGVMRAGFDGGGLQMLHSEPTGFDDGLAVDVASGRMYWTDTNASVIRSANLNGTEAQIVLDDFGQEPLGIALDVANDRMYWTDREGVKRARLSGGEAQLLNGEPARGFCALDLVAQRIYWADWPSGNIKTAPMTPGAPVTNLVTKQAAPFGVAVDHAGGKLYWLELNLNKKKREQDQIRRANLDGSEVETVVERPGAGFEGGLAVDPAAGKLYWSEAEAHDISSSNLDGSQLQTLFSTGEAVPVGMAVETADPRPASVGGPSIEGIAQVGSPLRCNPGTWTGIGPVSFGYQWAAAGGPAVEGATGSAFVPSFEDAGDLLVCVVRATDAVEAGSATSAALRVAAPPPTYVAGVRARLIAGISSGRLRSSGRRARVPVFTTLPVTATLKAIPLGRRSAARRGHRSRNRGRARSVTVRRRLAGGRATITLTRLVPGARYRLELVARSADGQSARSTATLRVERR
jgi:hypothetical protein